MSRPNFPDILGRREVNSPGASAHKAGPTIEERIAALERGALAIPGVGVSNGSTITSDTSQTGGVKWSAPAYGRALPTSAKNHTSSANWQKVALDALDVGSGFTLDNANDRVSPNESGVYAVQAVVGFGSSAAGQLMQSRVYRNGIATDALGLFSVPGAGGAWPCPSSVTLVDLATTDYIEMWAWQNVSASTAYVIDGAYTSLRFWRVR